MLAMYAKGIRAKHLHHPSSAPSEPVTNPGRCSHATPCTTCLSIAPFCVYDRRHCRLHRVPAAPRWAGQSSRPHHAPSLLPHPAAPHPSAGHTVYFVDDRGILAPACPRLLLPFAPRTRASVAGPSPTIPPKSLARPHDACGCT